MRDYAKISPTFWTGKTGRSLRGNVEAQIVALYLLSCPHANMIGVFHCPVIYISHETGLPFEGAYKGLQSLIEGGFCTYEEDAELVFVHEMARYQIGEQLKSSDNRVKGILNEYEKIPAGRIKQGFYKKYKIEFYLPEEVENTSPSEAPYKPLGSQEQEQEQEQKQEQGGAGGRQSQSQDPDANPSESLPPASPSENLKPEGKQPGSTKGTITFRKWLERIKAQGEQAVPENDPIFAYAEDACIPSDFLRLAWVEFRVRYAHNDKRYKDWRLVFRRAVRENWFNLWYCEAGGYLLTSKGQQALVALQNREKRQQEEVAA